MELIHGGPPALPGSCYLCSSGDRKRYIDTKINVEFHGAMYMCDLCIAEMAQKLGMATEEQVSQLNFEVLNLRSKEQHFREEIQALKGVIDGYDDVRSFLDSPSLFAESSDSSDLREEGSTDQLPEGEGSLDQGESGPSEQTDDEGMGELRTGEPTGFEF